MDNVIKPVTGFGAYFYENLTVKSVLKYVILILVYSIIFISNLYASYMVKNPYRLNGIGECYDKPYPAGDYKGLEDVLHFSMNDKFKSFCKNFVNWMLIISILLLFICFIPYNVQNMKIIFLFTTLIVVGFIFRVIAFSVTVPPPPNKQNPIEYKWYDFIKMIFGESNPDEPTSDFMFSGHTIFIVMVLLFLWNYRHIIWIHHKAPKFFLGLLIFITILGIFALPCISMSGLHYSNDIVIGIFAAIMLFLCRHFFALKLNYHDLV